MWKRKEVATRYFKAMGIGFGYYGLNGFYEMHKAVCEEPNNPWGYALDVLNELTYEEFKKVAATYLSQSEYISEAVPFGSDGAC